MDKEVVVYIHCGILLSHKRKALDSVLIRWMPIIQSEVSQKEKDKYRILVHMESRKMVLMSLLQGSNGDADIENRLLDTVGEGEGGTNGKSSIGTYTLPYATLDSQGEFAAWRREVKSGAQWQPRRVGRGGKQQLQEGGDIYIYLWLIHADTWQKPTQYCKATVLQFKVNLKTHWKLKSCSLGIQKKEKYRDGTGGTWIWIKIPQVRVWTLTSTTQSRGDGTFYTESRAHTKKAEREPALTVDTALKSEATASRFRGCRPGSDLGCGWTSPPLPLRLVVAKLETRPEEWPGIRWYHAHHEMLCAH